MIAILAAAVLTVTLPVSCPLMLTKPVADVQALKCKGPGTSRNYPATAHTIRIEVQLPPTCKLVLTGPSGAQTLGCQP